MTQINTSAFVAAVFSFSFSSVCNDTGKCSGQCVGRNLNTHDNSTAASTHAYLLLEVHENKRVGFPCFPKSFYASGQLAHLHTYTHKLDHIPVSSHRSRGRPRGQRKEALETCLPQLSTDVNRHHFFRLAKSLFQRRLQ